MKKLVYLIILFIVSFLIKETPSIGSSVMSDYCYVPPSIGQIAAPNVLFVIDVSGSMLWCAYNPKSDGTYCCDSKSGCGWTYKGTEEGYFEPDKIYKYNSTQGYWEVTTGSVTTCPKRASSIDKKNQYKGACLNFHYMRRVDLVRWAITGGRLTSCNNRDPKKCDPELYGQPNANLHCDGYGCTLDSESGQIVRVPWNRINDSLAMQFKKLSLQPRLGVMFFSDTDVRDNKVYIGDFTSSSNFDGVNPYKNLISTINDESPEGGTPTAPALWDAYNYFAQNTPKYNGFTPQQGNGDQWKNPMYQCFDENQDGVCSGSEFKSVPCAKNFVILLTDGQWNYGGGRSTCTIDTGYESNSADPVVPAYWLHKKGFTNSKTKVDSYVEAVYGIGLWLGGTGEKSLKNVAMYGSFNRSKNWPDNLNGYPTEECDHIDDCCSSPNCGKGSSCTDLPASSMDWDKDNDGKPDTFYSASDALEIKDAIRAALFDILRRVSSGSTVATLASRTEISSLIIQPYFYPKYLKDDGTEIGWLGFLRSFWIDLTGHIREDTIANQILDLATNSLDLIIQFFVDSAGDSKVAKITDVNVCTAGDAVSIDQAVSVFNSGCVLAKRDNKDRTILFNKDGTLANIFSSNEVSNDTAAYFSGIWTLIDSTIDSNKAKCIIRYISGDNPKDSSCNSLPYVQRPRELNIKSFCGNDQSTTWKLGDIINSTPSVSSDKPLNYYHLRYGDTTYLSYITDSNYKARASFSFVGANDGMLHAFRVGTVVNQTDPEYPAKLQNAPNDTGTDKIGQEEWAFIPKNAIPYLIWYGHNDYCHVPTVDYRTMVFDASINGNSGDTKSQSSWRTLLVGVMGFGGKKIDLGSGSVYSSSIFVLDLTDWMNGSSTYPTLLWEQSLPDNTLTTSFPSIVRLGDSSTNGTWYVVLGTGPSDPDGSSYLNTAKIYFYNLKTGSLDNNLTLKTGSATVAVGDINNIDVDDDYQDDTIYFGVYGKSTNNPVWGNFYRISLKSGTSYKTITGLQNSDIQNAVDLSTFKTGNYQPPVFAAPAFTMDVSNNVWVYFGTGKFLNNDDKSIPYTNYLIGYKDPYWNTTGSAFTKNDLINVASVLSTATTVPYLTEKECICDQSGCALTDITYNQTQLSNTVNVTNGWYYGLSGEAIISQPFVYTEMVNSLVFIPPGGICEYSGKTRYISFYYTFLNEPQSTIVINQIIAQGVPPLGQPFQTLSTGKLIIQTSSGSITQLFNPSFLVQGKFISWIEK